MSEANRGEFEAALAGLLTERATEVRVEPDEPSIRRAADGRAQLIRLQPTPAPTRRRRRRIPRLLTAAAAVVAVALLAGAVLGSTGKERRVVATGRLIPEGVRSTLPDELRLRIDEWLYGSASVDLDPDAAEADIDEIAAWLSSHPEVDSFELFTAGTMVASFNAAAPAGVDPSEPEELVDIGPFFGVRTYGNAASFASSATHPAIVRISVHDGIDYVRPGELIGHLRVEESDLDGARIEQGLEPSSLQSGFGRVPRSADPGHHGNSVLVGQRSVDAVALAKLVPGDEIVTETIDGRPGGVLVYRVLDQGNGLGHIVVDEERTDLMQATDTPLLTIIVPSIDAPDRRLVVRAELTNIPVGPDPEMLDLPDTLPPSDRTRPNQRSGD